MVQSIYIPANLGRGSLQICIQLARCHKLSRAWGHALQPFRAFPSLISAFAAESALLTYGHFLTSGMEGR